MDFVKIKKTLKLNWVPIAIIGTIVCTVIAILVVSSISLYHFFTIESYPRKLMLAGMSSYIFLWLVVGSLSGFIHTMVWIYFVFGGGFAKISYKRVKEKEVDVRWSDVIGMEAVKKEVWEVITLLKDRVQLRKVGGKVIRGVLMVGPPGCGKTYVAKAMATETGIPFLPAVGSEFIGIFMGQGAMTVKNLFKKARVLAGIHGGCIVFIDEIDSIARPRVSPGGFGGGVSYNATINQLLAEMDGVKQSENNIVVIAATNINEAELDPALMRAGRFDRKIYVGKPGLEDRKKIFAYYLEKTQVGSSIDVGLLARKGVGFSPADIASMVREASLIAVRNKREEISYNDLSEAYDRVVFGLKSHIILNQKEKKWVAYHEAGHAIVAYLTHPTDDVIKASIIPHKSALGYIGHRPPEEIYIKNKEWYLANIKTSLGSYAGEKLIFNSTSSGVEDDFRTALFYAQEMVWRWGMGESGLLGNFQQLNAYFPISEKTKNQLDKDSQKILSSCLKEVEEILGREKELYEYFAQELFAKGELEYDNIVEIFNKHGKKRPQEPSL